MDQEQIPPTPTPPEQTPPIRTISIPPSHTIRNWFIGSGVVIALLATAGLYFGMPWINSKLKNQETTNTTNTATEHASMNGHTEIITQDEIGTKCKNNTIKEHGEVVRKNDLIVYSTECIIKKHDNNSADSVIRYYVRDAAETFNRRQW